MMMTMLPSRLILFPVVLLVASTPCQASFVLPLISKAEQRSSSVVSRKIQGQQQQRQHHAVISMSLSSSSSSSSSRTTTTTTTTDNFSWVSLDPESLVSAKCLIEQTLCQATTTTTTTTTEVTISAANGIMPPDNQDVVEIVMMPRLAKNADHATAILNAWRLEEQDFLDETGGGRPWKTLWKPGNVIYKEEDCNKKSNDDDGGSKLLYGHLIGRVPENAIISETKDNDDKDDNQKNKMMIPGIILFHTGAGPHDLFLLWKAASIVNQLHNNNKNENENENNHNNNNNNNNDGCLVLIADLLSDETGWAWDDDDDDDDNPRARYHQARDYVLKKQSDNDDGGGGRRRPVLRQRIQAAIDTLLQSKLTGSSSSSSSGSVDNAQDDDGGDNDDDEQCCWTVDPNRVAALGWCLGGHAILELASMARELVQQQHKDTDAATTPCSIRALATFHGVFDGLPSSDETSQQQQQQLDEPFTLPTLRTEVLICHGTDDPFVSDESLERALACLQQQQPHITTSLLQLQGARHGFTNPAQDFHPNQQAFGYNHEAATKAWKQTMNVLRRNLL